MAVEALTGRLRGLRELPAALGALPRRKGWLKAAVLSALVLGGGAYGWRRWRAGKPAPPPAENTTLAAVERGTLKTTFQELGDLAAKNKVDVASKVSGRIIELYVKEGQKVRAGQKLAVIQPGRTGAEKFVPSTVTSPIDGILLAYVKNPAASSPDLRFADIGDYVTGVFDSQTPTYMMTVADMRSVIVKLRINEMDVLKLRDKMPVTVTVDALKDEEFPATVSMISPQAEKESRGGKIFRVEVTIDRNDPRLRTGMTARVVAVLDKREKVLRIPLSGVFEDLGNSVCYVDVPGGKPRQTVVKTGLRTETDVEVLEGLKEGEKVLTEKPVDFTPVPGGLKRVEKEFGGRSTSRRSAMGSSGKGVQGSMPMKGF